MSSFDELLEEQRRRVHELEFSRGAGMSLPAPAVREILRNSGELEAIRRLALEDRKVWKKRAILRNGGGITPIALDTL